jgi:hypothetical protein
MMRDKTYSVSKTDVFDTVAEVFGFKVDWSCLTVEPDRIHFVPPTLDEKSLRKLIKAHWPFFWYPMLRKANVTCLIARA